MKIKQNCRFFKPDIPCLFHKEEKIICKECRYYQPVEKEILIIKRDALGDVLRTTSILSGLKKKFPSSRIIWFTSEKSKDVLEGNHFIDEIWTENIYFLSAISYFSFDILINLDLSFESMVLAGNSVSKEKIGFWYDKKRKISFSNSYAEKYFWLSHNDEEKKKNKKTYQEFLKEIIGLDYIGEIVVPLKKESIEFAEKFAKKNKILGKKVIGVNIGSGSRWITKRWPEKNFLSFFSLVGNSYPIIILGGEEEKKIYKSLISKSKISLLNPGFDNKISDFFAILNLCEVILTADTLALHAGIGLGKKVVALFGPTSSSEIETYGRCIKIITPMECYCCYKRKCPVYPKCMELIKPEEVFKEVKRCLNGE